MKTYWRCEKCDCYNVVEHESDADVYSVVNLLAKGHERVSPDCKLDLLKLRVSDAPFPAGEVAKP